MKKIIVTGASGFIGRNILPILLRNGWEIHAVCFRTPAVEAPGVIWHAVDLLDRQNTIDLFTSVHAEYLLHLAWYVEPATYWSSPENFRWVRATLEMMDVFRETGGKHLVVAGTCAEYDWNYGFCSENVTPLAPATIYGKCKHGLRQLLEAYGEAYGMRVAWGRIFYLYGPYEAPSRLVPSVTRALLKGENALCSHGNQIRDFMHVADAASAFACLVESDVAGAINIGSGEPVTLRQVVDAIAGEFGAAHRVLFGALPSPPGEPPFIVADNRRLLEYGWTPAYDLAAGIAETVAWWRSQANTFTETG